jgi:hypothetical protein
MRTPNNRQEAMKKSLAEKYEQRLSIREAREESIISNTARDHASHD